MKPVKLKFEWEYIDVNTCRAKVIGGWILSIERRTGEARWVTETTTFIPDPLHAWELERVGYETKN